MSRTSDEKLVPRNGHTLKAGVVCRISGCANQKELSLEDQLDNAKEEIAWHYSGPQELLVIATKGKGEDLTRSELDQIRRAYRSRQFDVFIYDDLGRLIRGGEASKLLGIGVDHGTRSICIADGIDTVEETWEEDSLNACSENVAHNQRTSKRIKQKTMNRFRKRGFTPDRGLPGYIVPEGARSYDEWQKDGNCEGFVREGERILRKTLNGEAVAAYFNRVKFPVGKFARNEKWDGTMALRFFRNPTLKGLPLRGKMATVKHHETGKRVSRRNPKGATYYEAPHLAYFDSAEFDSLTVLLAEKNGRLARKARGRDARSGVPRNRTKALGQHATCWYCGRPYVWGGNGMTGNLMCSGARKWNCWNSIGFNGALAAKAIVSAIESRIFQVEGIDAQFRAMVLHAQQGGADGLITQWKVQEAEERKLESEGANLKEVVLKVGSTSEFLQGMLQEFEQRLATAKRNRQLLELKQSSNLALPSSALELREQLHHQFQTFATDTFEFGDIIRELTPSFYVYLVRLCDGGHLLPRAKVQLDLLGGFPDAKLTPSLKALLGCDLTLDLFVPPEREQIRVDSLRLAQEGIRQREIAQQIPSRPTQTAVWKALELQRRMDSLGQSSPYLLVDSPPADYQKLRRHLNAKYHFKPLRGYVRPSI